MARLIKKRRQTRRSARLEFAAIEVVGGLLPTDLIGQIAAGEASEQAPEGYAIPKGLKLRDEIARYLQIALGHWESFEAARDGNASAPISFVQSLLSDCFGFRTLSKSGERVIFERHFPLNFAAENGRVPIIIAPIAPGDSRKTGIDEVLGQFGDESRRRSATQLMQEYLNADEDALWGITTDGLTLRILRDNASMTRPAWIEVNLEKIFTEGLFPDFSAVWLLLHASRFGVSGTSVSDCPLERWKERSRLDGAAAKDKLRLGVEAALIELGRGFVQNPANNVLRELLQTGKLSRQSYYEELLRLVYRLIFLFAAEDRDLLHMQTVTPAARKAYLGGYSVARLRERSTRHASLDKHNDTWEGMKALFNALADGQPDLGVVALGGLFDPEKLENLTLCRIKNKRFLKAIWHLSWFRPADQPMTRINWRDMETQELGSVYESLLELTPELDLEARDFTFAEGDATRGNARKVTGSYYTPDSLVKLLLDTTLDPVLDAAEARNPDDPVAEILKLSIIDPACGSGHFLIGAARRAAARIARHRMPGAISKDVFQHALREVVSNCIYGTDRNPMAVELCKVALWIEALEPGKPLSFLDARIQCGDSLIGVFNYGMLRGGIPNEAYTPMTGDDKEVAKAWERLNKDQRDGRAASGFIKALAAPAEITDGAARIAAMPEETLAEVRAKARAFARFEGSAQWQNLRSACDMYVAAFFAPKVGDVPTPRTLGDLPIPTTEAMWMRAQGQQVSPVLIESAAAISAQTGALHWPLVFPAVMARGGFDAIIGNPPWERIKLSEKEFFASRVPAVANAKKKSDRKKLIDALALEPVGSPGRAEYEAFMWAKRAAEAASFFARKTGRFPLTGTGDVNTYALFAEHFSNLANKGKEGAGIPAGRAGMIVPTGIATDSSTSAFFGNLVDEQRLSALIDFENREKLFEAVDSRMRFSILAVGPAKLAEFSFFLLNTGMRDDKERRVTLSPSLIAKFNPNTKTAPLFRARTDAELTAKFYDRAPILIEDRPDNPGGDKNPWGITFQRMFDMASDSGHFEDARGLSILGFSRAGVNWEHNDGRCFVPLYEAKMIHHYDHRWATFESVATKRNDDYDDEENVDENDGARDVTLAEKQCFHFEPTPRYWVPSEEAHLRASRLPARLKRSFRKEDPDGCLKVFAEWILGTLPDLDPQSPARSARAAEEHLSKTLGRRAISTDIVGRKFGTWLGKVTTRALEMQRETPLTEDDLEFIQHAPSDMLELTGLLIDRKQPRWLMGWRDITNATNERTLIASVFPKLGTGDTLLLKHPICSPRHAAALNAMLCSLSVDYVCRQKIGGTHLKYNVFKQNAVLPPDAFTDRDLEFIVPRVLELTYTSSGMREWAQDLGHTGSPFAFDPDRRGVLRAELDAFFAKKFGLMRDELRYILDPHDIKGQDYPSETFRGLKTRELSQFNEYRSQRLVLEAFDKLTGG